ncbi:MAG TPA: peptide chain release factor N(5)-glutamine methyltransferase [Candidatus Alistipes merdipullorum]|nr:peptide chain release factor N(5)-glutamine methyltransferase [Candidatus Alistipes merdipullorum]
MEATRSEITAFIAEAVRGLYPEREARRIALTAAAALSGESEAKFLADPNQRVNIDGVERCAAQLAAGCPVQYVTGKTEFCDMTFHVDGSVLIPRPETEELVLWAEQCAAGFQRPRILDVCTGSGCIAIVLAAHLPQADVTALDISHTALETARRNAAMNGVRIRFIEDDALNGMPSLAGETFDIIVSNPPYIPHSEIESMHVNVTRYEPHEALFVDDADPLVFYRAIARAARTMLSEGGSLLFEVHKAWAERTAEMLRREGFGQTEVRIDLFGKPRMTCSRRRR